MSENKKPRLAEVLGIEVEEKFNIRGHYYNPYFVDNEGVLIIVVKLYKRAGVTPFYVLAGDKIAQLVIFPVELFTPTKVDHITGGERGNNGFGSTGR